MALEKVPQPLPDSPISGTSPDSTAVSGESGSGIGVEGISTSNIGVQGSSSRTGVSGRGNIGVQGINPGPGTLPVPDRPAGVVGSSVENYGVYGASANYDGVKGVSNTSQHAGVSAINTAAQASLPPSGFAVWAVSYNGTGIYAQGNPAGYFYGDVLVTGDVVLTNSIGSDVAEDFDLEDDLIHSEPGTVLIINENGKLSASIEAYDTRVAGVISGAGELKPAVVLQRIPGQARRSPLALIGKTFCKADAEFGSIAPGDLLTTSPTRGHAMKVTDRSRSVGAALGKALGSLSSGRGLIPILVNLR